MRIFYELKSYVRSAPQAAFSLLLAISLILCFGFAHYNAFAEQPDSVKESASTEEAPDTKETDDTESHSSILQGTLTAKPKPDNSSASPNSKKTKGNSSDTALQPLTTAPIQATAATSLELSLTYSEIKEEEFDFEVKSAYATKVMRCAKGNFYPVTVPNGGANEWTVSDPQSWETFDLSAAGLSGEKLGDYIEISIDSNDSKKISISAKKATEGIISGDNLVISIVCESSEGDRCTINLVICKAILMAKDGNPATIPFGVDISNYVKTEEFIRESIAAYSTQGETQLLENITAADLVSLLSSNSENYIKYTPNTPGSYPNTNANLNLSWSLTDPNFSGANISASFSDMDASPTVADVVKRIARTDGTVWINEEQVLLEYTNDLSQSYKFGNKLTENGNIETAIDQLIPYSEVKDTYAKNTSTEHVVRLDGLKHDSEDPSLVDFSVADPNSSNGPNYNKDGILGFFDKGSSPVLSLTLVDAGSGADGISGVESYILNYKKSLFASGSITDGNIHVNDDKCTADIALTGTQEVYTFADFELIVKDYAGNTATYSDLSLFYENEDTVEKQIKKVIIWSVIPKVALSPSGGMFNYNPKATLTIDKVTLLVLQEIDPGFTVMTLAVGPNASSNAEGVTANDFASLTSTRTLSTGNDYAISLSSDTKDHFVITVDFKSDGEYTVAADLRNVFHDSTESTVSETYIIDTEKPVASLEFDNNDSYSENYYNAPRTAKIHVFEKNFAPGAVDIRIIAADDAGSPKQAPAMSAWMSTGQGEHTANVVFNQELHYKIEIVSVADQAGNYASDLPEPEEFVIDMTPPEIKITGLENTEAFAGEIHPVITFSDAHFEDFDAEVRFTLATGEETYLFEADSSFKKTIKTVNVASPEQIPENDNVYIMQASITDKAGNTAEETRMFSVNRFGSTYLISEETSKIIGTYVNVAPDIVVTEINASGLRKDETILRTAKNVERSETLQEDAHYNITKGSTLELWSSYVYTIPASYFVDDGHYRIVIRSIDLAGNLSENTMDNKSFDRKKKPEIGFSLDTTPPTASFLNVVDNGLYVSSNYKVQLRVEDNLGWEYAKLLVNGVEVQTFKAKEGDISSVLSHGLTESEEPYSLELVVYDRAKNSFSIKKSNVSINSDPVAAVLNNPVLFNTFIVAGILALAVLAGATILLVAAKRKRDKRKVVFSGAEN
jgi:hypothetical protein